MDLNLLRNIDIPPHALVHLSIYFFYVDVPPMLSGRQVERHGQKNRFIKIGLLNKSIPI